MTTTDDGVILVSLKMSEEEKFGVGSFTRDLSAGFPWTGST